MPPEIRARLAKRRGTNALRQLAREMQAPLDPPPRQLHFNFTIPSLRITDQGRDGTLHPDGTIVWDDGEVSKPRNSETRGTSHGKRTAADEPAAAERDGSATDS
jgi:hypothetical protein